jgi:CRISPR/Cas system CMR subunit Cmr6 (Cas7 group RAMP superfamily)
MKYIIVRPGIPTPTQAEADLMMRISTDHSVGSPIIPDTELSGIFSYITSDLTKEEIAIEYQSLSDSDDETIPLEEKEVFPVLIFEVSETFSYNKDMSNMFGFGESIGKAVFGIEATVKSMEVKSNISELDINQLLDLMQKRGGFENLTEVEQTQLNKLSNEM